MRVLFVTRKYPPAVGGMEQYSYDLYNSLKDKIPIDLLANTKGNSYLVPFLARAKWFILRNRSKYTHIHFGDGLLAPLAVFAKLMTHAKISITIHAKDIMYPNLLYQMLIPRCVARLDKVVCVSNFAIDECVKRGVSRSKCVFIPNGIVPKKHETYPAAQLWKKLGLNVTGKKKLLSLGRLIKRKGHEWFIDKVMPSLPEEYVFIIAGTGPEEAKIRGTISRHSLQNRVLLIGGIDEKTKWSLYKHSDLFIMPNIKVPGDAEGFGITLLEAASMGLPSIASDIEGIRDAVIPGKTGLLRPSQDYKSYTKSITKIPSSIAKVIKKANRSFHWPHLSLRYQEILS